MIKINKIHTIFLVLALVCPLKSYGQTQIMVAQVDTNFLQKGIKYDGKIKNAIRWTDSLGDNIVLTTETGSYQINQEKNENDLSNADLFAYLFVIKNGVAKLKWRVHDFIKECPVDLEATFIENTLKITDLNKDGIGEVWLMYKTACRGDVSPADLKIIMYQGQQKHAMRSQNKVKLSENESYGGEYKFDKAFEDGPKEFRDFALKMWEENIMEKWGTDDAGH